MTDELDEYYDDNFNANERNNNLDLQRDMTAYFGTSKSYGRKRISPTAMGNCEKKMVLMTIPQPNDWNVWGEVYARAGNTLEDFIAGFYDGEEVISDIVKSYMSEVIPHIFDDEIVVQKVVHGAIVNMVTGFLQNSFGVGKLISQDNIIAVDSMRCFSKADLFLDVEGKFVIGEVKSLGDMPFDASPYKDFDNEERLAAIYKKKYYQLTQLLFYTSIMACNGQMIYISRNAQKGNGSKNSPKYFNGANTPVPFDEEEALKILQRIHFSKICMDGIKRNGTLTRFIPQTPDHMKPEKGRITSSKCGFCDFQNHCHKGKDLNLDMNGFQFMKDETAKALWAKCREFAIDELRPKKLLQNRLKMFGHMKEKGVKMSKSEYLGMFDYQGYEI